ncbi:MAG: hypothetical protein OXT71_10410 [Acidobacteriota bacterium]|nr:hypothetical protein [Acidobacteriota bacterium]
MRFSLGTALGIEVHGPDLVLAVVRKGFRHFELQDHAVIEDFRTLPPGRLRERIRQSVRSYGTLKDRIVLGVPRDEAVVRWLELPLEVEENLDQMVQFQVERLEPTEENGSYYEYQVLEKDEATGKLLIQITMLPRATLDRYLEILQPADLYPVAIRLSSIAYHQVLLAHADGLPSEQPCLALALNPGSIEMVLISGSSKYFSQKVGLGEEEAQTLSSILRHVDAFLSQVSPLGGELRKIYLSGSLARSLLGEFRARFEDCELLRTHLQLAPGSVRAEAVEPFLPAAGLAISGLTRSGPARYNLIPEEKRLVLERSSMLPTALLAGLLAVMAVALLGRDYFQQSDLTHQIQVELNALQPRIQEVMELRERTRRAELRLAELQELMQGREKVLGILREMTEKTPDDAFLDQISIRGEQVTMVGYASSASGLLSNLTTTESLDTVEPRNIAPARGMGDREKFTFDATSK